MKRIRSSSSPTALPTVSSEEYDKLINRRITAQANLSETKQSIAYYKQRLQTLKKTTIANSEDKTERIENDLEKVNKKVNDMIELVELTADDYYKNVSLGNAFNVLVPAAYDAATTVKSGISKAIVPCVGAEALIFIFYIGYSFVAGLVDGTKKKRAEKEAAAQTAAAGAAGGGDEPKDAPASDAETKDEPADETDKS